MKSVKKLIAIALVAALLSVQAGFSPLVYAQDVTQQDKTSEVTTVGGEIDKLWQYIEDNSDKPESEFYPGFVEVATKSEANISDIYNNVTVGVVTDAATADIVTLKEDVGKIRDQVEQLRLAAIYQDADQFELASDQLEELVTIYNQDIDLYNSDVAGDRTLSRLFVYAGAPAITFMLVCGLLAWAWLNERSQDVGREIKRRLRWYMLYVSLGLLAASAVPCALYFWTNVLITTWYWLPACIMVLVLAAVVAWYAKVTILLRRTSRAE